MATFEIACGFKGGHTFPRNLTRFGPLGGGLTADPQATENRVQVRIRSSYTLANMYVRVLVSTSVNVPLRSRVNGANGALLVTVTADTTGAFQDTVNSDSLVTGDLVNFSVVSPGPVDGGISVSLVGFTMVNASGDDTVLVSNSSVDTGYTQAGGLTRYQGVAGTINTGVTTESDTQYTVRTSSSLTNFRVFVVANAIAGTVTARTRVNLGNGAQSVSITASGTGSFEDTTNTDSVVAGDEINYETVTPVTLSTLTWYMFQVKSASEARQMAFGYSAGISLSADRFEPIEGGGSTDVSDAELSNQIAARSTWLARNLFVNVITHGATSGVDFTLRKNTAASVSTVNVPQNNTGFFEDTTNTVPFVSTDLYNYHVDHGAGAGSIVFTLIGIENGPVGGGGRGYPSQIFNRRPRKSGRVTQGLRVP